MDDEVRATVTRSLYARLAEKRVAETQKAKSKKGLQYGFEK
jgi:hypothetical protein